jgi:hypothetical protein
MVVSRCLGAVFALCFVVALPGCPHHRIGQCVIESPAGGGVPRLRQMGVGSLRPLKAPSCAESNDMTLECEPGDDLAKLEGTAKACGPAGIAPQVSCPRYGKRVHRVAPAWIAEKPCGPAACENVEVVVDDHHTITHVTFYDDPTCHSKSAPPQGCEGTEHACYYRVLAIRTELKGRID